jgi:hypothetical protein
MPKVTRPRTSQGFSVFAEKSLQAEPTPRQLEVTVCDFKPFAADTSVPAGQRRGADRQLQAR